MKAFLYLDDQIVARRPASVSQSNSQAASENKARNDLVSGAHGSDSLVLLRLLTKKFLLESFFAKKFLAKNEPDKQMLLKC